MIKLLVVISLAITVLTAFELHRPTCEERGGRAERLEAVGDNLPTEVCMPVVIETHQVDD